MKTKILLLKKGTSICCLLFFATLFSKLSAQIVYTDITPDATPNATYPLDLNNDGIVDFMISMGGSNGSFDVLCIPQNNNAYSGNFIGGTRSPWALPSSNPICSSLGTWYGFDNPGTMASGTSKGNWIVATDKYLALQLVVGTNTYYGWARLYVWETSSSFTIKDYAFESTPNDCIQTGKTITGIVENDNNNIISVYPNPFSASTNITTTTALKNADLIIYDIFGQKVGSVKNISGQQITIERGNLSSGLYFVRLTEDSKVITTNKLVITE